MKVLLLLGLISTALCLGCGANCDPWSCNAAGDKCLECKWLDASGNLVDNLVDYTGAATDAVDCITVDTCLQGANVITSDYGHSDAICLVGTTATCKYGGSTARSGDEVALDKTCFPTGCDANAPLFIKPGYCRKCTDAAHYLHLSQLQTDRGRFYGVECKAGCDIASTEMSFYKGASFCTHGRKCPFGTTETTGVCYDHTAVITASATTGKAEVCNTVSDYFMVYLWLDTDEGWCDKYDKFTDVKVFFQSKTVLLKWEIKTCGSKCDPKSCTSLGFCLECLWINEEGDFLDYVIAPGGRDCIEYKECKLANMVVEGNYIHSYPQCKKNCSMGIPRTNDKHACCPHDCDCTAPRFYKKGFCRKCNKNFLTINQAMANRGKFYGVQCYDDCRTATKIDIAFYKGGSFCIIDGFECPYGMQLSEDNICYDHESCTVINTSTGFCTECNTGAYYYPVYLWLGINEGWCDLFDYETDVLVDWAGKVILLKWEIDCPYGYYDDDGFCKQGINPTPYGGMESSIELILDPMFNNRKNMLNPPPSTSSSDSESFSELEEIIYQRRPRIDADQTTESNGEGLNNHSNKEEEAISPKNNGGGGDGGLIHGIKRGQQQFVLDVLNIHNNIPLNMYFVEHLDHFNQSLLEGDSDPKQTILEIPEHFLKNLPEKDEVINYNQQYNTLTIANVALENMIGELQVQTSELSGQLSKIEQAAQRKEEEIAARRALALQQSLKAQHIQREEHSQLHSHSHSAMLHHSMASYASEKKIRIRRNADEIERLYICPYTPCTKAYGSEGSLNQHVKLKHPQYCFGGVEQFRRPINTAVGEVNSHFRANSAAHTMGLFKDRPTFFD